MTLEDLLEIENIKQLRIKYSHFFDGKRIDELADLFAQDAICEFGQDYGGDWAGKEVIRTNFQAYANGEGLPFGVLHAVTNPLIELKGKSFAHGRWYCRWYVATKLYMVYSYSTVYGICNTVSRGLYIEYCKDCI